MAFGARELLLIVRAQNQASGTLRSVSRDLRGMAGAGRLASSQTSELARRDMWRKIGQGGAVLRDTGRSLRLVGLAGGAALGALASNSAEFDKQVTLAATQTGKLDSNLRRTTKTIHANSEAIQSNILQQMEKFPAASKEMAGAAYEIFSSTDLGLRNVAGGMKLLNLFNKASVAGQTDLNEVTQAGISIMQGYRLPVEAMPKIMNRAFAAVRFGRMTFADLTQSLNTLVPAAIATNQTFDTVAGTMAYLTRRMPNVRMAGTALARLMELFGRKKFVDGAKQFGVAVTDSIGRIRPLPAIIEDFRKRIDKMPLKERANMIRNLFKELSNTEGTIQARRALTHLLSGVGDYRRMMALVTNDNNEFQRSYKSIAATRGVRFDVFKNQLRALGLEIGRTVIPAILELSQPVQRLVKWFHDLDDETRKSVGRWAVYGAALLLAGGMALALLGGLVQLIAILGRFRMIGYSALAVPLLLATAFTQLGHGADVTTIALKALSSILGSFSTLMFGGSGATRHVLGFATALAIVATSINRVGKSAKAGGLVGKTGGLLSNIPVMLGGGRGAAARELRTIEMTTARRVQAINALKSAERRAAGEEGLLSTSRRFVNRSGYPGPRSGTGIWWKTEYKAAELSAAKVSRSGALASRMFSLTAASAALLPGPLKVAAGLTAVIGGAAYLWSKHQKEIADQTERNNNLTRHNLSIASTASTQATKFGGFGTAVQTFERAQISLAMIKQDLKDAEAAQKGMSRGSSDWVRSELQIRSLKLDQLDAMNQITRANQNAQSSFNQMGNSIASQTVNLRTQHTIQNQIARLRAKQAFIRSGQDPLLGRDAVLQKAAIEGVNKQIVNLQRNLDVLRSKGAQAGAILQRNLVKNIRDLQSQGVLPKAGTQIVQDVAKVVRTLGRMATLKELKLLIKADLDPSAMRNLPVRIRRLLANVQKQHPVSILLKPKVDTNFARAIGSFGSKVKVPKVAPVGDIPKAQAAWNALRATFKPIRQRVSLPANLPSQATNAHAAMAAAFAMPIIQHVTIDKKTVLSTTKKAFAIHSPSGVFAKEIGEPLAQGLVLGFRTGIQNQTRNLHGIADLTIDVLNGALMQRLQGMETSVTLFSGKFLQDLEAKIAETTSKVTKAKAVINDTMNGKGITHRKSTVAKAIWDSMLKTPGVSSQSLTKDLQGQRMLLQAFNRDITTLARRGVPRELLLQLKALGTDGEKYIHLLATSSKKELRTYTSEFKKMQKQIATANRITAKDILTDIGISLKQWQMYDKAITRLSKRNVPNELLKQLAQMGPEAAVILKTLAGMSEAQLKRYVAAWQKMTNIQKKFADEPTLSEIKQKYTDFFASLFDPMQVISDAQQMGETVRSSMQSAFGDLFSGPGNLADKVGQAFQDAHNSWEDNIKNIKESLASAQKDLANAQKDLVDAQAQAVEQRAAELQSAFGELFSGDWIKTKLDWGAVLGISDLKHDLQDQLDSFRHWRNDIAALTARGLPKELMAQLEKLGPGAVASLDALVGASDTDLSDYVSLWSEAQKDINTIASTAIADTGAILDQIKTITENIATLTKELTDALNQEPKALTFADILSDLTKQSEAFVNWQNSLVKLKGRNVPSELIDQLRDLGPEAAGILAVLSNSTDSELATYIDLWRNAGVEIDKATGQWVKSLTAEDILAGMRKQKEDFRTWVSDVSSLVGKLPDALVTQLRDMGPDAATYIHLITTMSEPQLAEFIALWKTGQADITAAATAETAKQQAIWTQHGTDLAAGFSAALSIDFLPKFQAVIDSAFASVTTDFNTIHIPNWVSHGGNLVNGLITGWTNNFPNLRASITTQLAELHRSVGRDLGIESPSKKYAYFGKMMVAGLEQGASGMGNVLDSLTPTLGGGASSSTRGNTYVEMNVQAHQDESLMSTLAKASFKLRTRTP